MAVEGGDVREMIDFVNTNQAVAHMTEKYQREAAGRT
jgi:hypothetical protein